MPYRVLGHEFASYGDAQRAAWVALRAGRTLVSLDIATTDIGSDCDPRMRAWVTREWWTVGVSGKFRHHDAACFPRDDARDL